MNKNLLLGVIRMSGDRQEDLADAIGISLSALSAKINGKREFKQKEIAQIRTRYSLTNDQLEDIFFGPDVSCEDTEVESAAN